MPLCQKCHYVSFVWVVESCIHKIYKFRESVDNVNGSNLVAVQRSKKALRVSNRLKRMKAHKTDRS